jgi:two-component system response regulator DevR
MDAVNILIVEDNRHMSRLLSEMIRGAYQAVSVLETADAGRAHTCCHEARPELVLMDVALPDSSGIDLAAQIKARLPQTKVVIVSNHRDRASRNAAHAAGAEAYVFKDEIYEKLLSTLATVLRPHTTAAREDDR